MGKIIIIETVNFPGVEFTKGQICKGRPTLVIFIMNQKKWLYNVVFHNYYAK